MVGEVFKYKNLDTSQKAIKNPDTLCYAIFHGIFEIGREKGEILYAGNNSLCVTFLYAKQFTLCYVYV